MDRTNSIIGSQMRIEGYAADFQGDGKHGGEYESDPRNAHVEDGVS